MIREGLARTLFFAKLSKDAYNDTIERDAYFSEFIEGECTQCHVLYNAKDVVIVFRGTESFKDFTTDIKAVINEKGYHTGFYEAYMAVREDLLKVLKNIKAVHKDIYLTGHSLGGALCILAVRDIKLVSGVETFGAPMIGNDFVANWYVPHFKTKNWQNGFDIVPRLPSDKVGYEYVGEIRYLPLWGKKIKDYRPWFVDKFAFSVTHHKIDSYIKKIEGILCVK
jgi:triacylglycerol lipase